MLRRKKTLLLIPLVVLLLGILIIPPDKLVKIKSRGVAIFKTPLTASYRFYILLTKTKNIILCYRDYDAMKAEISQLKFALNKSEEERLESIRLRGLLQLKEKLPQDLIAAQVIGKEPTNWLNTLIINKGVRDQVAINQPVMNFSGLIGKVIEVTPDTAKVLLISDVNSRVVVLIQRTREEGMLEGIGMGLCRLKYLPVDADVVLGDVILSSGGGGVYPKGFVVGTVESIRIERGGVYKSCIVKPSSALSGIEEVLCIK